MPITDLLEQLFEFKWRDVSFPTTDFGLDLDHDQAVHEWPDRDGAHVEATGRKPLVHQATIPFYSNISSGIAETWQSGNRKLYPEIFRDFLVAMSTRTSGPLQHPELGIIQCKPKNCRFKWQAKRRDGCMVTATWIESLDDTVTEFQDVLASKSPVPVAYVASVDLDGQLASYGNTSLVSPSAPSFTDEVATITSAFDAATLVASQAAGKINGVIYRLQSLQDAVTRLGDVTAWPIANSALRLQDALSTMQAQLLSTEKTVRVYVTGVDISLPQLVGTLQTSITDLLTLNPTLAATPVVPARTRVRYYALAV